METLSVSLSGPAFSLLLYENMKSLYSQEGFLLGEIVEKETRTITDNDQRQVHVSRVVKINSCVPCPKTAYFYNGVGKVDAKKVKSFLGDLMCKVVAWYKYRATSSFSFTFRERLVHKQLVNLFEIPSEFFTCCLQISEHSDNGSTHSFTQNFVKLHDHGGYEQLPLHIVNLSDANNTYKSPEPVSETFRKILAGLDVDHKRSQGLTVITKIENALQKHTADVVEKLAEAEKKLFQLESEIEQIRKLKKRKDVNNSASDNKEINELIMMDVDSAETNTLNDSVGELTPRKDTRGRKAATNKREKKASPSKECLKKDLNSSAPDNKDSQLNDFIMMDVNSSEVNAKKSTRGRKPATTKRERRTNQSPSTSVRN